MHRLITPLTLPLLILLLHPLPTHAQQQQRCQWATLRSATDSVLETLQTGLRSTTTLPAIFSSPDLAYTYNGTPLPLPLAGSGSAANSSGSGSSVLAAPLAISVAHSVVDQDRCAAFIKAVGYPAEEAQTAGGVVVVGAQVWYNYTASVGATVRRMDVVVAAEGGWNMPVGLDGEVLVGLVEGEDWGALSRAVQDGRAVLEGVAGGYLDLLGGGSGGDGDGGGNGTGVVWGRPCARLEGSVYTAVGETESCEMGLEISENGEGITERQFVVDESVGSVSVLARDGRHGGSPTLFEFRVVKGALRYVHQFAAKALAETDD
ncbi:uncharacterized protein B0H64DRAFT_171321 [Chaetomium fimeti]|uniref:DUF8021 domain-containing protein n=1 Tax=Chaetomium fimeti TaxID=1854472 RepID=A0AAE0HHA0_9PEZI|nr:hypothetical protein B0H64DRAFT_171321 [Chaetomium fimeti]